MAVTSLSVFLTSGEAIRTFLYEASSWGFRAKCSDNVLTAAPPTQKPKKLSKLWQACASLKVVLNLFFCQIISFESKRFKMLTLILVSLLAFLLYLSTRKPKNFPPGPPRLPMVGSLPFMAGSGPSPSLLHGIIEQVKKHGPIFGFYFGKTPNVVIADYQLVS